jgi:hypothetical protein
MKESELTQIATLKSIQRFMDTHPEVVSGVRFSTHNYSIHNGLHSYPLYAVAGFALGAEDPTVKALTSDAPVGRAIAL